MLDRNFLLELADAYKLSEKQCEAFVAKFADAKPGHIENDAAVADKIHYEAKTITNSMSVVYKKFGLTEKGPGKANKLFGMIFQKQLDSKGVSEEEVKKELSAATAQGRKEGARNTILESPLLKLNSSLQSRIKKTIDQTSSVQAEKAKIREEIEGKEKPKILERDELNRRIKQALTFKNKMIVLSKSLSLSRKIVRKFFDCDPIDRKDFILICDSLQQPWASITDIRFTQVVVEVVPKIKENASDDIEDKCGTLQILDVERPIDVDDLYVDVNILAKLTKNNRQDLSAMPVIYNAKTEETDRFALGSVEIPRVPGEKAATENEKMMIYGKPGAGKTTFLKHIAIQCNENAFQSHCIPVFIQLRTYVSRAESEGGFSLIKHIEKTLHRATGESAARGAEAQVTELVNYGCLLILLDGLDEVPPEHASAVVDDIQRLRERFKKNRIIITCRIASYKYFFEGFLKVEISDFNIEQIKDFSQKWFVSSLGEEKGEVISDEFIKRIEEPEHNQVRELAVTPILLVLTCLVFQDKERFPQSRHQIYKTGVDILLSKWDKARQIKQREGSTFYKSLRIEEKRELLSLVAASTFKESEYYFEKEKLRQRISEYVFSYFTKKKEPGAELIGEEGLDDIIDAIASQHGLIIERAAGIYSFSHLTFQEYFTAENLIKRRDSKLSQKIIESITDKRYLEIYLLAAEMLDKADSLLIERKQLIDNLIADDPKIQEFLYWLDRKATFDDSTREPLALRAFYFDCYIHQISWQKSTQDALSSVVSKPISWILRGGGSKSSNLRSDYAVIQIISLIQKNRPPYELNSGIYKPIEQKLLRAKGLSQDYEFAQALNKLYDEFPSEQDFPEWWSESPQRWIKAFLKTVRDHRLLGKDWRFTKAQNELLVEYYWANVGLVSRLDTKAPMSPGFRESLRSSILMSSSSSLSVL